MIGTWQENPSELYNKLLKKAESIIDDLLVPKLTAVNYFLDPPLCHCSTL